MTPFEQFFAGEFDRMLKMIEGEPGLFSDGGPITDASWDRKAAYLLWTVLGKPGKPSPDLDDLLG